VKVGLQIPDFTWPDGPDRIGLHLTEIAQAADQAGFDSVGVMDHFFQIRSMGSPEREMLEAYTTLGFLAANTSRAKVMAMVTGAVYRHPGVLAKQITTLDVLSGGRAWLGIGAAWNDQEARGLGIPFPPLAERMERLEETIQICLQMWAGDQTPYKGRHYQLERPLNSPGPVSRPHPPILIGGSGERKTLRLVARYAQACNLFPTPQLPHKLDVLKAHCESEGRNFDEIEKTCLFSFDVGDRGQNVGKVIGQLRWLAGMGVQTAIGSVKDVWRVTPLEIMGRDVIPAVAGLEAGRRVPGG
jgi:F420-dependent oxidoreductase-like protein